MTVTRPWRAVSWSSSGLAASLARRAVAPAAAAAAAGDAPARAARGCRRSTGRSCGPSRRRRSRYGPGHRGVDFAARAGHARAGRRRRRRRVRRRRSPAPLHVVVAHDGDLRTSYSFLAGDQRARRATAVARARSSAPPAAPARRTTAARAPLRPAPRRPLRRPDAALPAVDLTELVQLVPADDPAEPWTPVGEAPELRVAEAPTAARAGVGLVDDAGGCGDGVPLGGGRASLPSPTGSAAVRTAIDAGLRYLQRSRASPTRSSGVSRVARRQSTRCAAFPTRSARRRAHAGRIVSRRRDGPPVRRPVTAECPTPPRRRRHRRIRAPAHGRRRHRHAGRVRTPDLRPRHHALGYPRRRGPVLLVRARRRCVPRRHARRPATTPRLRSPSSCGPTRSTRAARSTSSRTRRAGRRRRLPAARTTTPPIPRSRRSGRRDAVVAARGRAARDRRRRLRGRVRSGGRSSTSRRSSARSRPPSAPSVGQLDEHSRSSATCGTHRLPDARRLHDDRRRRRRRRAGHAGSTCPTRRRSLVGGGATARRPHAHRHRRRRPRGVRARPRGAGAAVRRGRRRAPRRRRAAVIISRLEHGVGGASPAELAERAPARGP